MIALAFCFIGLGGLPPAEWDLVEVNHCYHSDGSLRFHQVILWEWSPDYCRMHCQGFVLTNYWSITERSVTTEKQTLFGKRVIETWTDYDPERKNHCLFPPLHRCNR